MNSLTVSCMLFLNDEFQKFWTRDWIACSAVAQHACSHRRRPNFDPCDCEPKLFSWNLAVLEYSLVQWPSIRMTNLSTYTALSAGASASRQTCEILHKNIRQKSEERATARCNGSQNRASTEDDIGLYDCRSSTQYSVYNSISAAIYKHQTKEQSAS